MDNNGRAPLVIVLVVVALIASMLLLDGGFISIGGDSGSESGGFRPSGLGCTTCGREKKIACFSCGGSKRSMCMNCLGVTFKICQICAGGGKTRCIECLGIGYRITHYPEVMTVPCETCAETGWVSCPPTTPCFCGDGKQNCTSCDENGKIDCPNCD